jgi:hypothetical protein
MMKMNSRVLEFCITPLQIYFNRSEFRLQAALSQSKSRLKAGLKTLNRRF